MTALDPNALKAAQAAYRDHALAKDFSPGAVEKILTAYLDALEGPPPADEVGNGRVLAADGTPWVYVTVARSLPFAKALVAEWKAFDGSDHGWKLKFKSIGLPARIYDEILPRVRARLQRQGEAA